MITIKMKETRTGSRIQIQEDRKSNYQVKEFVRMHDGSMVVKISDGSGNCLWIDAKRLEVI